MADAGLMASLRAAVDARPEDDALRRLCGKSLGGGLLLWGPPGCGKTFELSPRGRW